MNHISSVNTTDEGVFYTYIDNIPYTKNGIDGTQRDYITPISLNGGVSTNGVYNFGAGVYTFTRDTRNSWICNKVKR